MQKTELLLIRIAETSKEPAFDDKYMSNLINMSAPAWEGIKDADQWVHELRGE